MTSRTISGALRLTGSAARAGARDIVGVLTLRGVSGPYVNGAAALKAPPKKSMLPPMDIPWFDSNMIPTERTAKFFRFMWETKMGGDNAPTVPDVANSALQAGAGVAFVGAQQTVLTQAVVTNAASLAATISSTQAAAAPGAAQIPPPVLDVPDVDPGAFDPNAYKRQF